MESTLLTKRIKDNIVSDYPKIMRHNGNGTIVKFTAYGIGTVVGTGHGDDFRIGHKSTTWQMYVFRDYKPEIHKTKG